MRYLTWVDKKGLTQTINISVFSNLRLIDLIKKIEEHTEKSSKEFIQYTIEIKKEY